MTSHIETVKGLMLDVTASVVGYRPRNKQYKKILWFWLQEPDYVYKAGLLDFIKEIIK